MHLRLNRDISVWHFFSRSRLIYFRIYMAEVQQNRLRLLFQSYTPHSDVLIQIFITIISSSQPRKLDKAGLFPHEECNNLFGGYLTSDTRRRVAHTHSWSGLWPISWYTLKKAKTSSARFLFFCPSRVLQLSLSKAKTPISISFNCP